MRDPRDVVVSLANHTNSFTDIALGMFGLERERKQPAFFAFFIPTVLFHA
jgi:hypothetical protein